MQWQPLLIVPIGVIVGIWCDCAEVWWDREPPERRGFPVVIK